MHRRLFLAGLAATGGLLTTAFLQAAVAVADTADVVSATGADAFNLGSYTFGPFTVPLLPNGVPGALDGLAPSGIETEGFATVSPFSSAPPLLTLGGGSVGGLSVAPSTWRCTAPAAPISAVSTLVRP